MKRVKRRYLALLLDGDFAVGEQEFLDAVWGALYKLYGEYGASLAGLVLVGFDGEARQAVLRANLVALDSVRASLASITHISGREAAVHVLAVSGTLKALRRNAGA